MSASRLFRAAVVVTGLALSSLVPVSSAGAAEPAPITVSMTTADGGALPDACVLVYAYDEFEGGSGYSLAGEACAAPGEGRVEIGPDLLGEAEQVALSTRTSALYVDGWVGGFWNPTRFRPGDEVDVVLQPAGVIEGSLTLPDGSPVPYGDAELVSPEPGGAEPVSASIVDGRWSAKAAPGTYAVYYQAGDRIQYSGGASDLFLAATYPVVAGETVQVTEVLLGDGEAGRSTVTGVVTEAGSGRVLPGMCVTTVDEWWVPESVSAARASSARRAGASRPAPSAAARSAAGEPGSYCPDDGELTDQQGRYEVSAMAAPDLRRRLVVTDPSGRHARWVSEPFASQVGARVEQDVALVLAGSLAGRVVDRVSGRPLEGVCPMVAVNRSSTTSDGVVRCSDSDGRWTVSGLVPGRVTVQLVPPSPHLSMYAPGVETAKRAALVTVVAGRRVQAPDTALPVGGVLTGTVRDRAGKPVRGITVSFGSWSDGAGPEAPSAMTDPSGRYVLSGLRPGSDVVQIAGSRPQGLKWARWWSGGVGDPSQATPVAVDYDTTTALDAVVTRAGTVAVTLSGRALPTEEDVVAIEAFAPSGTSLGILGWATAGGPPARVGQVPLGQVLLRATVYGGSGKRRSWWYRAPQAGVGTRSPVTVTSGGVTAVTWVIDR
ncbi:MAG: carboxypeptidase-like regulatory domain-containing protein [Kineosporiaceae bacterium]